MERVKKKMPKVPIHYATTCKDLIKNAKPKEKVALKESGVDLQDAHNEVRDILSATIGQEMAVLKNRKNKEDLKKRKYMAEVVGILKKYRLQSKGAKIFNIGRKMIASTRGKINIKINKNAIPVHVKTLVIQFYEDNAIFLPDKKMVSKKTQKKTMFLTQPVSSLFSIFKETHPEIKIAVKKFYSLRPNNIKLQSAIKFRGCLCEYCTNIELKATALNKLGHSHGLSSFFQGVYSVSRSTLCPKQDGNKYHKRKCIDRKCNTCGTKQIAAHLAKLAQVQADKPMSWKKWERATLEENGKQITKQILKTCQGTIAECIHELQQESEHISSHLHNASWQNNQFSQLTKKIPDGCVVMVLDFAENFVCTYQDEIQSAHWYHTTATIHPIVCYYSCQKCDSVVQESLVFISDDKTHDFHAVHEFMNRSVQHLKKKMNITLIAKFSDQCSSQYKSKGPFMDLATAEEEYGIKVENHYFSARHGKGPSDGETAVVKRQATSAVVSGRAVINNAHDLFEFCKEMATEEGQDCQHFQRQVFFVNDINRERGQGSVGLKTVKGTRKLHCAKGTIDGRLFVRNLSCFCDGCSESQRCHNLEYVDQWESEVIFTRSPPVTKLSYQAENATDHTDVQANEPSRKQSKENQPSGDAKDGTRVPDSQKQAKDDELPGDDAQAFGRLTDQALDQTDDESQNASSSCLTYQKQAKDDELPGDDAQAFGRLTDQALDQTDDESQNASSSCLNSQKQAIAEQDFVAVRVPVSSGKKARSDELHVAQVASIHVKDDNYSLSYMVKVKKTDDQYIWPQGEEVFFLHPISDIVAKLQSPEPVASGSRLSFRFKLQEAKELFHAI